MQGPLKIDNLAKGLTVITGRHEVLRSTFSNCDGYAACRLLPHEPVQLPVIDLTVLDNNEREHAARNLAIKEARQPFDLASGPLLRGKILKLDNQDHVLLLTSHRIVADDRSMDVIVSELARIYGREAHLLPELPVQFDALKIWQWERVQNGSFDHQLSYWKDKLSGKLPLLELPTDRPRPPVQSYHGAAHRFHLPASLTQDLKSLSQSQGVTLQATLMAAFLTLLWRYTRQEDILIGTPHPNRDRAEFREVVGPTHEYAGPPEQDFQRSQFSAVDESSPSDYAGCPFQPGFPFRTTS